ncbi:GTPase domain-containing protein [Tenacibaculum finnmarkense]|uniref:GTPase domain-containing protein n=1 Tax=Tenacibaculum finnmarkense TaxID=2781243 RepID=UPI001EFC2BCC|nr:GTPase domain-containing protein [Tenacibaculum finnmarkense]MCG8802867.1 GTPase domain-containing protein [Tenacibaculum finnmarkense]MCG8825595.1 GTPase domain-containing protein [Tenacibaculum finnmarkense]
MLPLIILGGAVLLFAKYLTGSISSIDKKEIYISVLGPISSGKTVLHNFFRNTNYKNATIAHNNLDEVILKKGTQAITLKKGRDISGSEQAVSAYYKEEITKSDVSFFLFNSSEIIKDEAYSKNVNGRLNFINKYIKTSKKQNIKIILIASHFDKVKNNPSAKEIIWNKISKIASEGKINKPIYINLTNNQELEKLKNELFK